LLLKSEDLAKIEHMQRRIFIGIILPHFVIKHLVQKTEKWHDLPVRWTHEDNLHITLLFLGLIEDEELPKICAYIQDAANQSEIFELKISGIVLGPDLKRARIIWAIGETNEDLRKLSENIEKKLGTFTREKKELRPHVTLGRIKQCQWKVLSSEPIIDEKINLVVPVDKVEILESVVEDGKKKYLLLESCPLK
jgi:RNA 2',3'-cyclic 3'-phosphodiesterase